MKRIFLGALAVCLAALTACAHADGDALRATFFAAGAADAILIQTENSAVLIDAGL